MYFDAGRMATVAFLLTAALGDLAEFVSRKLPKSPGGHGRGGGEG